jgi:uncharacterized membrane protein YfbV (UPF0208 family)
MKVTKEMVVAAAVRELKLAGHWWDGWNGSTEVPPELAEWASSDEDPQMPECVEEAKKLAEKELDGLFERLCKAGGFTLEPWDGGPG